MVERKTLRPVTLRRVVEVCSLATNLQEIDAPVVSQRLNVSPSRASEIILEVEKMGLLRRHGKSFGAHHSTAEFLRFFNEDRWEKIHEYFLQNYRFYRDFINLLEAHINEEKGLSMDEIREEAVVCWPSLNQTAIEVLTDWCDRLGIIQRHLYTRRLYLTKREQIDPEKFKEALTECYQELTTGQSRRGVFAEIPMIRENLCERLKMTRKVFDETLRSVYWENIGKIELSGAPITTLAKKSPLSEKKMKIEGTDAILSPKLEATKLREGLLVGQKTYYYIAIHEDI